MPKNRVVHQGFVHQQRTHELSVQPSFIWRKAFDLYAKGKLAESLLIAEQAMATSEQDTYLLKLAAVCHMRLGNSEQAISCWRQVLDLNANYVDANSNSERIPIGKIYFGETEAAHSRAMRVNPDYAKDYCDLGRLLTEHKYLKEAEAAYRQAVAINPDSIIAHYNLGVLLQGLKRYEEAEAVYRQVLRIKPTYVSAQINLGALLEILKRPEEAEAAYRQAVTINPESVSARYNFGVLLQSLKRFEEAETAYRQVLRIKPTYVSAHVNLGALLEVLKRPEEAEAAYRQAVAINPASVNAHYNLGVLLQDLKRFEEAETAYRKAIHIKPEYYQCHYNLGRLLQSMRRFEEAEAAYRQVLRIKPDYIVAYSNLLFIQNYRDEIDLAEIFESARKYGELAASKATPFIHQTNADSIDGRLRIGLVSGDFRHHSVGYFLEGVIATLDPAEVELFAYATSDLEDALTQKFKEIISHWRSVVMLSDIDLAQMIRSDAIDILMDLSGHTAYNRLPVFAWKPAPVQVTWLGYCATTGVGAIDYILSDSISLPSGESGYFVEKPWHLPDCYICFTAPDLAIPVAPSPADIHGLVTFGSFNNFSKVTDAVVACWAKILRAVSGSRLFLKNAMFDDPAMRRSAIERFERAHIPSDRLILEGRQSRKQHLECYHRIDIALDPFPYPGVTTSVEALWMGVPVLTKKGDSFLSRQGESLLNAVGLSDWIAADVDDYVLKAVAFANDLPGLATLRAGIRQQVLQSPLFDCTRFASNLTKAWKEMWRIWCHSDQASMQKEIELLSGDAGKPQGIILKRPLLAEMKDAGAGSALHSPFRLHIGGSDVKEGWQILSIKAGLGVDYVGDCRDLSLFPDGCCDEIYASHVIEHIPYGKELLATLVGFHRVMKPGAPLRISVPDLDVLCKLFLDHRMSGKARFHVMRIMFGGQMDANDFHYVGLNFELLSSYLVQARFRNVQRVDKFSIFKDASSLEPYFGIPISLNVEAVK